jgi:hypothetical protein
VTVDEQPGLDLLELELIATLLWAIGTKDVHTLRQGLFVDSNSNYAKQLSPIHNARQIAGLRKIVLTVYMLVFGTEPRHNVFAA